MKQMAVLEDVWALRKVPNAPDAAQNVQHLARDNLGCPVQGRYLGLTRRVL